MIISLVRRDSEETTRQGRQDKGRPSPWCWRDPCPPALAGACPLRAGLGLAARPRRLAHPRAAPAALVSGCNIVHAANVDCPPVRWRRSPRGCGRSAPPPLRPAAMAATALLAGAGCGTRWAIQGCAYLQCACACVRVRVPVRVRARICTARVCVRRCSRPRVPRRW